METIVRNRRVPITPDTAWSEITPVAWRLARRSLQLLVTAHRNGLPFTDVTRRAHTAKYIKLVEELAAQMGRAHGWRRRAAERLGISESHLSKIVTGDREVGRELAERAVERLGLDPGYFSEGAYSELRLASGKVPISGTEIQRLLKKVDAGKASVSDVYALARAVAEAPAVAQAQAILKRPEPRTEKEIGALFVAATKLASAIAKPAQKKPR